MKLWFFDSFAKFLLSIINIHIIFCNFFSVANKAFLLKRKKAEEAEGNKRRRKKLGDVEAAPKRDAILDVCETIMNDVKKFKV